MMPSDDLAAETKSDDRLLIDASVADGAEGSVVATFETFVEESNESLCPVARLRAAIEVKSGVAEALDACFKGGESPLGAEIIDAFHGETSWLAELVKPEHLLVELDVGSSIVTRVVIGQWLGEGKLHSLVKLADGLLDRERCKFGTEARISALIASFLAFFRPERAQGLLEFSRPLLMDTPADQELAEEARGWVEAGALVKQVPLVDRMLWNRRLREPDSNWDWESAEARMALSNLSRVLADKGESATLFRGVVPGCWWDLMDAALERVSVARAGVEVAPAPKARLTAGWVSFAAGAVFGSVLLFVSAASVTRSITESQNVSTDKGQPALVQDSAAALPAMSIADLANKAMPPPLPKAEEVKLSSLGPVATEPVMAKPVEVKPVEVKPAIVGEELVVSSDWKSEWFKGIKQSFEQLDRMQSLIRDSGLKSAEVPLRGGSSMAPFGSPAHVALLEWLMIDPPKDPDVRRATQRIYIQTAPRPQVIALLEKLAVPDGPYYQEIQACAQLLLDSSPVNAPKSEMDRLTGIVAAHQ